MANFFFFLFFFMLICLFSVIFVGMALFEHHSNELDPPNWESGEIDKTYYPDDEDNVIFRS